MYNPIAILLFVTKETNKNYFSDYFLIILLIIFSIYTDKDYKRKKRVYKLNYYLQLTSFITLKCTSDLIAKVVSSTSFFTTFTITYNSFSANIKIVSCKCTANSSNRISLTDKFVPNIHSDVYEDNIRMLME